MDVYTSVFMAIRDRAAALAEVRPAPLDYWAPRGLIIPSVNERLTPGRAIKLYSDMELLAVLIVAEMRRQGVSLQHIRAVVDRDRARGIENPLTEIRYAVVGRRLEVQDEDSNWEDGHVPGQGWSRRCLHLRPLQARIRASLHRPKRTLGVVERRRGTLGSREVVAGTRIPVETIRHFLEDDRSTAEILENYPLLTPEDVEAVRATSPRPSTENVSLPKSHGAVRTARECVAASAARGHRAAVHSNHADRRDGGVSESHAR